MMTVIMHPQKHKTSVILDTLPIKLCLLQRDALQRLDWVNVELLGSTSILPLFYYVLDAHLCDFHDVFAADVSQKGRGSLRLLLTIGTGAWSSRAYIRALGSGLPDLSPPFSAEPDQGYLFSNVVIHWGNSSSVLP